MAGAVRVCRIDAINAVPMNGTPHAPCRLPRRLMAVFYDALLLFSVFMFAAVPAVALNGGEAVRAGNPFFSFYLLSISYFYFTWQWKRDGRTLGMRAWHIRLIDDRGPLRWRGMSARFALALVSLALLGAGFLWAAIDPDGLALHDRWSGTRLIVED